MREIIFVFFGILVGIFYDINVCYFWILKVEDCVGIDFIYFLIFFRFLIIGVIFVYFGFLEVSLI